MVGDGQDEDRDGVLNIITINMSMYDQCHYEDWLIILTIKHMVILFCTVSLVFYLARLNKVISTKNTTTVYTALAPAPDSPSKCSYMQIASPFSRNLRDASF